MKFPEKLRNNLLNRRKDNSYRELFGHENLVDFSSNDYLGFSRNMNIYNAVKSQMENMVNVNGSTGSRLLSGNHDLHLNVEQELAVFFNSPAGLIFNSGFDANIGLLSSVPQHGDTILFDELCHASLRDGVRLSNARSYGFKHNDLDDLHKKYKNTYNSEGHTYVVVESIYSMDGTMSALKKLVEFCRNFNCYLIVDEAHATGFFGENGRGLVSEWGLENYVFARVHTFGKALGCHGAVVLGAIELREVLINYARSFIYTTAMPLHNVLCIKYGVQELLVSKEIKKLRANVDLFKEEIKVVQLEQYFLESDGPIQSFVISDPNKAKEISAKLRGESFDVKAILSPTVALGSERLRFCIHSYNSSFEIKKILKLLSTFV